MKLERSHIKKGKEKFRFTYSNTLCPECDSMTIHAYLCPGCNGLFMPEIDTSKFDDAVFKALKKHSNVDLSTIKAKEMK